MTDVNPVDDVVEDIDELRQGHRNRQTHDVFDDAALGKIVLNCHD